jgi:hypothetical protein
MCWRCIGKFVVAIDVESPAFVVIYAMPMLHLNYLVVLKQGGDGTLALI